MLKPSYIIESGAMLGWGTYMLRKAAGKNTHIIVVSPLSAKATFDHEVAQGK